MAAQYKSEPQLQLLLERALGACGFHVEREHFGSHDRPDLEVTFDGREFVVELKSSGSNRSDVLHGLMAAALLQARRHATARSRTTPLPIVAVSSLTDRAVAAVAGFMTREAPGTAWGILDRSGELHLRGIEGIEPSHVGRRRSQSRIHAPHELDPFTDLGQWMAKVLVAKRLPERLLAAPRTHVARARHLAHAANVSEPTAARWVKLMRSQSFLDDRTGGLRIVRTREFFNRWQRAVNAVPQRQVPARFSLPTGKPDYQLHFVLGKYSWERVAAFDPHHPPAHSAEIRWKQKPRACLALFEATAALGHAHVIGSPIHFYLETIDDESLGLFGLERSDPERAHVRVIEPAYPESLFRASVIVHTRHQLDVPSCDILQAWLDVAEHPARGKAQADEIERDVLSKWIYGDSDRGDDT